MAEYTYLCFILGPLHAQHRMLFLPHRVLLFSETWRPCGMCDVEWELLGCLWHGRVLSLVEQMQAHRQHLFVPLETR